MPQHDKKETEQDDGGIKIQRQWNTNGMTIESFLEWGKLANKGNDENLYPARALRAQGLLLADSVPTVVGWDNTFVASDGSCHKNGRNSETKRAIWIGPTSKRSPRRRQPTPRRAGCIYLLYSVKLMKRAWCWQ